MGDFVQINVSNSQNDAISFEKKFPKDIKISDLKVNKTKCLLFSCNLFEWKLHYESSLQHRIRCFLFSINHSTKLAMMSIISLIILFFFPKK